VHIAGRNVNSPSRFPADLNVKVISLRIEMAGGPVRSRNITGLLVGERTAKIPLTCARPLP
jgi:hypothetical protein